MYYHQSNKMDLKNINNVHVFDRVHVGFGAFEKEAFGVYCIAPNLQIRSSSTPALSLYHGLLTIN